MFYQNILGSELDAYPVTDSTHGAVCRIGFSVPTGITGTPPETCYYEVGATFIIPTCTLDKADHTATWKDGESLYYAGDSFIAKEIIFELQWVLNTYGITWVDGDGNVICVTYVLYGDFPAYPSAIYGTPEKATTDEFIFTFANWSPEIVTATQNATYTAEFVPNYVATVAIIGGTDTNSGLTTAVIPVGSSLTVKADTPPEAKMFIGWYIGDEKVSGLSTYEFTPEENLTIEAKFAYFYTVTATDASIDGYDKKSINVMEDTVVSVTADVPPEGYVLEGLYLNGIIITTADTYTVTVNDICVFKAVYAEGYTITVCDGYVKDTNATQSVIAKGAAITVVANDAPNGKVFCGWQVDDETVSTSKEYTITPTDNITLTAIYEDKVILSAGAIVGIVIGSVTIGVAGGFAIFWFIIKKKSIADLIAVFKKKA